MEIIVQGNLIASKFFVVDLYQEENKFAVCSLLNCNAFNDIALKSQYEILKIYGKVYQLVK